jgi:hypothetical protein
MVSITSTVPGANLADAPRRFESVHDRHLKIQDHHIGVQFRNFFDRDSAILRLPAHSPVRVLFDISAERPANEFAIVDNQEGMCQKQPPYPNQAADRADRTARRTATRKGESRLETASPINHTADTVR